MIYIESASTNPYFNLALEEYVFENLARSRSCFMLWQNDNTIVVGKYQNTAAEINQEEVDARNTRVVRRLSGGGAVYHDKGNLNYTIITDSNNLEDFNFRVFVQPVVNALEKAGVHAEFNGRNDITINGLKFSGNSQYVKHGRVLHHGCIMLDSNIDAVSKMLTPSKAKFESRAAKSVISRVTTINANAPRRMTMEEFKELLKEEIGRTEPLESLILSREQEAEIVKLQNEKYATWEWNFGRSPACNMMKEQKFPSGLVSVYMQAENGMIKDIRIFGDFFGISDIAELESCLRGQILDDSLGDYLEHIYVGKYINGLSASDLYRLIRY